MKIRNVTHIIEGQPAVDGAGVHLIRVFGHAEAGSFDPFLLLDAFDSTDPASYVKGFPWHPHRGIQTVTYLVEGKVEHGDTLGNKGNIEGGDCQWMVAGKGIIHQEMPQPSSRLYGCQLWINLPADKKMMDPIYQDILDKDVPCVEDESYKVRIIAGNYEGKDAFFSSDIVPTRYLDVTVKKNSTWSISFEKSRTVIVYLLEGKGTFDESGKAFTGRHAMKMEGGDTVQVTTGEEEVRFLFLEGEPLHEKIAWGGPIVMNTREELSTAFRQLDEGTFLK